MRVKIYLRRVCITIKMNRTPTTVSVVPVRSQHGSGVRKRKYICRKNRNIDSAVKLGVDAMRGEDMDVSLQHVKRKAARSNTGKMIGNALKEQAIDSAVKLGVDAMRGEDMDVSLQNEMEHVKRKAADGIENVHSIRKKQLLLKKVKPKFDFFG